jgi:hypothetical protein
MMHPAKLAGLLRLVIWPLLIGWVVGCHHNDQEAEAAWALGPAWRSPRARLEQLEHEASKAQLVQKPAIAARRVPGAASKPRTINTMIPSANSAPPYVCVCRPVTGQERRQMPKPKPSNHAPAVKNNAEVL